MQLNSTAPALFVSEHPRGLQVDWGDGQSSFFHYVWLRDCCYCEACGDCLSSHRRYVPGLGTLDARPDIVSWDENDIRIEWAGEAHQSVYSTAWLSAHRYDDSARAGRRPLRSLWDASTPVSEFSFDFAQVKSDDQLLLALHKRLISHGVVILRGGPSSPGGVLSFAELFGEVETSSYGPVFDLTASNAAGTAGTTLRAVPPHSDEPFVYSPPGIEMLACVRPAETGGDSIMVDGFHIARRLRESLPAGFESLAKWNHAYIRLHPGKLDRRAQMPVIALDDDGEISGIRLHTRSSAPLDLPEHAMEEYLEAWHHLCALMMAPENQLRIALDAGDAIVFDNHRALHARTEFSDRNRFLQLCGVSRERFHEAFRLLATRLGDVDAANQVLRAGACR